MMKKIRKALRWPKSREEWRALWQIVGSNLLGMGLFYLALALIGKIFSICPVHRHVLISAMSTALGGAIIAHIALDVALEIRESLKK